MPPVLKRIVMLIALGALLLIGNYVNDQLKDYVQDVIRQCGIAIILAVSLNIVNGLTGQFSIGHAGFMAVGAYTGASITYFASQKLHSGQQLGYEWMLLALLCGGLMAAAFGYIVGVPSLRLRGDYLAIVTLGFGEIIRVLISNSTEINSLISSICLRLHLSDYGNVLPSLKFLGGATGFSGDSGAYSVPRLSGFIVVFGVVIVVLILVRNVKFSIHGLAFMSIREDEIAADAMGVNTTRVKVSAFVMSAFFSGMGGVLFAHALFFNPTSFGFLRSMEYVVMVVLGGSGSITGAALAAIVLTPLSELLKPVQEQFGFGNEYRQVIYALILVIMMLLRPGGVFGRGEFSFAAIKRLLDRWRRRTDKPVLTAGEAAKAEMRSIDPRSATLLSPDEAAASIQMQHESYEGRSRSDAHPATDNLLRVTDLTRKFGGLTAVGDVNLKLNQGDMVGLIGPNGAGKTTLFNLLTGVYEPSSGKIEFADALLAGDRPYTPTEKALWILFDTLLAGVGGGLLGLILASSIVPYEAKHSDFTLFIVILCAVTVISAGLAFVTGARRRRGKAGLKPFQFAQRGLSRTFQNIRLFNDLTVLENVRLGTYVRRKSSLFDALFQTSKLKAEERESIQQSRALLSRFNLLRFENEIAKNLPYGDQRRLEIVRALATQPELLLLDEPAAGMNPQEKGELMGLIRQIRDQFGLTILLIEHDMKLVMGICERIYVLDYGRIIAEGTPMEIRSNPAVIAAYLGEEESGEQAGAN